MRRVIDRTEHPCEVARERLRLVTSREQREAIRVGGADRGEPIRGDPQGLVPGNRLELAGASDAGAPQRRGEPCRRDRSHDTGGPFAAEHPSVDRMVAIALDVAELAVLQMYLDAATAGAHVAGRARDGSLRLWLLRCRPH